MQSLIFNLTEAIDSAANRATPWEYALKLIGDAYPGGFVVLHNKNFLNSTLNSVATYRMDQKALDDYSRYYFKINPWIDTWKNIQQNIASTTEKIQPSSLFSRTEFFNDWMKPQGDINAAAGIKIQASAGDTIQLIAHYPLRRAARYDAELVHVLNAVRGNLARAARLAQTEQANTNKAVGAAALVARHPSPAFVLQTDCRLVDANPAAEQLFRKENWLRVVSGRVQMTSATMQAIFSKTVMNLCAGRPTDVSTISLERSPNQWQLALHAILNPSPYFSLLAPSRRMALIIAKGIDLSHHEVQDETLARRFALTPAECSLCRCILAGKSLNEAASALDITIGSARTRLKSIFSKTQTSRQAELALLLVRLSR